jgi:hypothetical protein
MIHEEVEDQAHEANLLTPRCRFEASSVSKQAGSCITTAYGEHIQGHANVFTISN